MARIDVQMIRDAIDEHGIDHYELAQRLGWYIDNRYRTPDSTRVKRRLGLIDVRNGRSKNIGLAPHKQRFMLTSTAVKMLEAVGLDPVDIGL